MRSLTNSVVDAWISRRARPNAEALEAVRGLSPAVVITGRLAWHRTRAGAAVRRGGIGGGDDRARPASARRSMAEQRSARLQCQSHSHRSSTLPSAEAPAAIDAAVTSAGLYTDTLVNNAGLGLAGPFHARAEEDLERLIALNIAALTRLTRHVLPSLRASRARRDPEYRLARRAGAGTAPGGLLRQQGLCDLAHGSHSSRGAEAKACVSRWSRPPPPPGPVQTTFHRAMGAEGFALSPHRSRHGAGSYRGQRLSRLQAWRTVIVPGVLGTIGWDGAARRPRIR